MLLHVQWGQRLLWCSHVWWNREHHACYAGLQKYSTGQGCKNSRNVSPEKKDRVSIIIFSEWKKKDPLVVVHYMSPFSNVS